MATNPTAQLAEETGEMLSKQLQCSVPGQLKPPLLLWAVSDKHTEKSLLIDTSVHELSAHADK